MKLRILFLLFFPLFCFGQDGVKFIENEPWEKVVALAKKENRMIFVDCYASYCVPCKIIDKSVFQSKVGGDYFNEKFICFKVQMDTAKTDSPEMVASYPQASKLKAMAEVVNFPTYAFFSPDGQILHRFVGGTQDPNRFIDMASAALDPNRQFYTLKKKIDQGNIQDKALLKFAAAAYQQNADIKNNYQQNAKVLADRYVKQCSPEELLTRENIEFVSKYTSSTSQSGFSFVLNHAGAIDSLMGTKVSRDIIEKCVFSSEINPRLQSGGKPKWDELGHYLTSKYPAYAEYLLNKSKISYYSKHKEWSAFIDAIDHMIATSKGSESNIDLSSYAFEVFRQSTQKTDLNRVLKWTEKSLENRPDKIEIYIIHASILQKLGNTNQAIDYLEKAQGKTKDPETRQYIVGMLQKMKNNSPILNNQ